MIEGLLGVVLLLLTVVVALQVALLRKKVAADLSPVQSLIASVQSSYERTERSVREEIGKNRDESSAASRQGREEQAATLKGFGDTLNMQLAGLSQTQAASAVALRDEIGARLKGVSDSMVKTMGEIGTAQRQQLGTVGEQLEKLTASIEKKLDALKTALEEKLKLIQEDNTRQLDQMRATVDEKLQGTLEKRLGESFQLVTAQLEQVHRGLGEMQTLATGVGDLKKVLTNAGSRGAWGEVQLGALLEQVLTPEQYSTNVATKGGGERVEFAIKLPGRGDDKSAVVWLPIDAKFPTEDYLRLIEAHDNADAAGAEAAIKQLESRIKGCARDIYDKYIDPPNTTDFGILFLPTEGLFAEVTRRTGLTEYVQRECHTMIAGPTTLNALLNSFRMGFQTLVIQKRSSEVWNLLSTVKTEFGKYGDVLGKVQKKLQEASNTIDTAALRTRAIERKLRDVHELPTAEPQALPVPDPDEEFASDVR
jgi:DNA recombination protein RmuC